MESKIVIFIVSTILAQSFGVQGSLVSFLPDDAVSDFDQMLINQASTVISKYDAFDPIYDIIRKLLIEQTLDDTPSSSYDSSPIVAESLVRVKDAIDSSLATILIAAKLTTCDAVESARTASYSDLEDAYSVVSEAIALAQSSDSIDTIMSGIATYQDQAQDDLNDLVVAIYDSARTCSGATSDDELDVIQAAQEGSGLALYHLVNSLFNAIRLFANAVATESTDLSLVSQIEEAKRIAQVDLMSDVENKFSALKAIYVNSYLDKDDVLSSLSKIMYAEAISTYRYANASDALFDRIKIHLTGVSLGISAASGSEDFSLDNEAQAVSVAKWIAGSKQILMSLDFIDSLAAEETLEQLTTIINQGAAIWTEQFNIAKAATNYSEAKSQIDTLSVEMDTVGENYVDVIFDVLVNANDLSDTVATELESLRTEAVAQMKIVSDGIADAYAILANAVSGNSDASASDNIDSVATIKKEVISASGSLADAIASAGIIVLINE